MDLGYIIRAQFLKHGTNSKSALTIEGNWGISSGFFFKKKALIFGSSKYHGNENFM